MFDLLPFIQAANVPTDPVSGLPQIQKVLPRQGREVWRARILPVDVTKPDNEVNWSIVREGQLVRVPLLPYRISRNPAEAFLAAADIVQRCVEAWPNTIHTHIIMGQQVQDLAPEGIDSLRVWIGFAARIE
jgi:hypothetical protein